MDDMPPEVERAMRDPKEMQVRWVDDEDGMFTELQQFVNGQWIKVESIQCQPPPRTCVGVEE